jgi:hypothetical protein
MLRKLFVLLFIPVLAIGQTKLSHSTAGLDSAAFGSKAYFACGADSANTTTWDKFPMGVQPTGVVIDSVHFICLYSTTPNFTPTISYGTDVNATGTSLGSFSSVASSHVTSAVGKGTTIPAGNDVWITWGSITTLPRRWAVIIWGHLI